MREERYSIRRTAESPAGALWKRSNASRMVPRQALSIEGMGQGGGGGAPGGGSASLAELSDNLSSVLSQMPGADDGASAARSTCRPPGTSIRRVFCIRSRCCSRQPAAPGRAIPDDPVPPVVGAPDRRLMSRLNDLMVQSKSAANDVAPAATEAANFETIELEALRDEPEVASATEIDRATIEMLTRVFRFALDDDSIPPTSEGPDRQPATARFDRRAGRPRLLRDRRASGTPPGRSAGAHGHVLDRRRG